MSFRLIYLLCFHKITSNTIQPLWYYANAYDLFIGYYQTMWELKSSRPYASVAYHCVQIVCIIGR